MNWDFLFQMMKYSKLIVMMVEPPCKMVKKSVHFRWVDCMIPNYMYDTKLYLSTLLFLKKPPFSDFFSYNLCISQSSSQHWNSTMSTEKLFFPEDPLPHVLMCGIHSLQLCHLCSWITHTSLSRPALHTALFFFFYILLFIKHLLYPT